METVPISKIKYGFGAIFVFVAFMIIFLSHGNTRRFQEVHHTVYSTVSTIKQTIVNNINTPNVFLETPLKALAERQGFKEDAMVKESVKDKEHAKVKEDAIVKEHVIVVFNLDSSPLKYFIDTLANRCEYTNCRLTTSRSNLRNQSAIIFFLTDAPNLPATPPVSRSDRNPDQAWVFSWLESPVNHGGRQAIYGNTHWRGTINWTMSYINDADIDLPYGHLTKQTPPVKNYTDIFLRKTKMAAWVVSHCKTQSKREVYVEQLKKDGIDVDIYGRCADNRVEKDFIRDLIDGEYKFYLSFENSFCKDYITEKFLSYYQLNIIPVVRGGGNYSNVSPNRTFINTADFSSIKALGEYLQEVGSSEELYTEYLRNKDEYASPERLELRRESYCEICKRLNNLETYRKTYTDLVPMIHHGTCFEPSHLDF